MEIILLQSLSLFPFYFFFVGDTTISDLRVPDNGSNMVEISKGLYPQFPCK